MALVSKQKPIVYPLAHGQEVMGSDKLNYTMEALPTGQLFHRSDKRKRIVMGPVGSGKSVICCQEIFRRASNQAPDSNGVRRTRWAIIRATYPQLKDTTMKTFLDLFPEVKYGKLKTAPPPEFKMEWEVEDKYGKVTQVECEILFRALDRPQQVENLLSLEITGAWVNEARGIPKVIFDALDTRIGRFPSKRVGGATWMGIIMDSNPCDVDHWIYEMFEVQSLPGHEIWHQDGNENNANLPTGYYENISIGKDPEWVKIYVKGLYGFICDGKPVYPEFNHNIHVSEEELNWNKFKPLLIGFDFGLTPAMVVTQITSKGQWVILHEEWSDGMGINRFGDHCLEVLNLKYPGAIWHVYADPAGEQRAQTDEKTCYQILDEKGFTCQAGAIDFTSRREAIATRLNTMIEGMPAMLIDGVNCKMLVKGMMGGYQYSEIANSGRYHEKPLKNSYSHPHDALQYIATEIFTKRINTKKKKKKRPSWQTV